MNNEISFLSFHSALMDIAYYDPKDESISIYITMDRLTKKLLYMEVQTYDNLIFDFLKL